jgi:hypothetical protein
MTLILYYTEYTLAKVGIEVSRWLKDSEFYVRTLVTAKEKNQFLERGLNSVAPNKIGTITTEV